MVSRMNEQFWKEFFELYRSFPELWQVKSECYKNKNKKNAAYEVLLTKLREIDSNASLDNLKCKINSLRSSYRREFKKKKRSEKSGAGVKDIYVPTLWYFDDLSFLEDQVQLSGFSSIKIEENEEDIVEENRTPSAKKYKKDYSRKERSELLAKAVEVLDNSNQQKDDASTLSSTWELLFRKLSSTQQLFANKAIVEVLYQRALERLDENSYKLFEKKTTQHGFPPRSSSTPFFSSDTSSAASQYFVSTPLQSP
ncbi:uncharacterized protein LOC120775992 [Bactrocera tryoni]|uniref:uncharacterized protein LOC120775992 n=1 Tax=Bactrocera tryoni TaxID=59916 RepID=UPI001A99A8DC|nr:uncharacterized protein LOC120775992 [Bactrocera tryoni]